MPLHPVVQNMLQAMRSAGRPALSAGSPAQARELVSAGRAALGSGPAVGSVHDLQIPTRHGERPARLYRSEGGDEPGIVLYLHGGGWVCGSPDDYDVLTRSLVKASGCALVSLDYRLAPEHPFPAGLEDARDAAVWLRAQMPELIGQRARLVLAGDSAGANLATVVAAELGQQLDVALQCLFYPVTDTDFNRPSYAAHGQDLPLTRADMRWFFTQYAEPWKWLHPDISPLRRPSLSGSPPAWIAAAEYDVLHDEAVEYANRLQKAGVAVTLETALGLPHGFARMVNLLPEAAALVSRAGEQIRKHCDSAQFQ